MAIAISFFDNRVGMPFTSDRRVFATPVGSTAYGLKISAAANQLFDNRDESFSLPSGVFSLCLFQ